MPIEPHLSADDPRLGGRFPASTAAAVHVGDDLPPRAAATLAALLTLCALLACGCVDAAKRDDRRVVQKKVGEVSDAVSYLADALQSAKNGGVFLDEQPIGKLRSDWQPGPGYEAVRSLTYAP